MNLILFDPAEIGAPLQRSDPRAVHLVEVLRRQPGDTFDAGVVNGPRGRGRLETITDATLLLSFEWTAGVPHSAPITLVIGLPRPQTARDILRDATTLGVDTLDFAMTEKGDANYARSTLWTSDEWQRHVRHGAAQAFCTRIPEVSVGRSLADSIAVLPTAGSRLALDNYEASVGLSRVGAIATPVCLCIGPERGWSPAERDLLRATGFTLVNLGPRVLRTETACTAALTLIRAQLGLL